MKTILVSKVGGVFWPRSLAKRNSPHGEQGETECLLNHLCSRGDINVVYFGKAKGELPCTHIEPCNAFTKDDLADPLFADSKRQYEGFEEDVRRLKEFEPVAFLQVAGLSQTSFTIDNVRGATVQAAGLLYLAPQMNACQALKIPRLVLNCDPRTYPKEQEMSEGWDWIRPKALLDQYYPERHAVQTVGGVRYNRHSIYGACETWSMVPEDHTPLEEREDCNIVAHSHVGVNIKNGSWEPWLNLLEGPHSVWPVWGAGWDKYPGRFDLFSGTVKPDVVEEIFARTLCSPVVAHTPGFYTGKPHIMAARGCVPLLYYGGTHTADPSYRYIPPPPSMRVTDTVDVMRRIQYLREGAYEEEIAWWRDVMRPRFDAVDALIDDVISGTFPSQQWGGYSV